MEVILKQDISGVGYKNDVVSVKPGFGRNYLIPQGFAIIANTSNKKMAAENVRQAAHKAEKIKTDALALAASIGDITLQISAKVGESGKIFGAVTTLQVSDALKAKGFEVDRKKIAFTTEVKMAGQFTAVIDLHKEVKHTVKFEVVAG